MKVLPISIFLLTFSLFSKAVISQRTYDSTCSVSQLKKIRLGLHGLTFQWEKPINQKSVFTIEAGMGGGLFLDEDAEINYIVSPLLTFGFRNYYNVNRRIQKGKSTLNNSANFMFVDLSGNGPSILSSYYFDSDFGLSLTIGWGMQRNLSRKLNFEWSAGVATGTDFIDVVVTPILSANFSFVIGKQK